jgi:hypothetical protein
VSKALDLTEYSNIFPTKASLCLYRASFVVLCLSLLCVSAAHIVFELWKYVTMLLPYFMSVMQWTQNNSELELRHSKRGREDGKGKRKKDGKESV